MTDVKANGPRAARNSHHKHPWMGLSTPYGRAVDIPKQLPELVRPVEHRAGGPRDAS